MHTWTVQFKVAEYIFATGRKDGQSFFDGMDHDLAALKAAGFAVLPLPYISLLHTAYDVTHQHPTGMFLFELAHTMIAGKVLYTV